MFQPYQIVQAYDRALIKETPADGAAGLEAKLEAAFRLGKGRDGALKRHQRSTILIRAAVLLGERLDASAVMINDHTAFRTDWPPAIRLRRRHPRDDGRDVRREDARIQAYGLNFMRGRLDRHRSRADCPFCNRPA